MFLKGLCSCWESLALDSGTGFRPQHCAYVEQKKPAKAIAPYLISQCILGCTVGLFWGGLMIATDTCGIRGLLSASSDPAATSALFLLGSVIVFLPAVLATAIGRLAD